MAIFGINNKYVTLLTLKLDLLKSTLGFTSSMDDSSKRASIRACVHCGIKESENLKLFRCSRCYNQQSLDTVYCSIACQKIEWKARHKKWHNEYTTRQEDYNTSIRLNGGNFEEELFWCEKKLKEPGVSPYHQLLTEGKKLQIKNNHKEAVKRFSMAIQLAPNDYEAHYQIGLLYLKELNHRMATEAFLNAMNYSQVGDVAWSKSFINVYQSCYHGSNEVVKPPSWLNNPGQLKVMAQTALKHDSDSLSVLAFATSEAANSPTDKLIAAR